jgi:hypothetical protein
LTEEVGLLLINNHGADKKKYCIEEWLPANTIRQTKALLEMPWVLGIKKALPDNR